VFHRIPHLILPCLLLAYTLLIQFNVLCKYLVLLPQYKKPGETIKETSRRMRPEGVNKWPKSMLATLLLLLLLLLLLFLGTRRGSLSSVYA
jgi:hypothetical protein